jgi:NADPH-dependent ferric siderophore reductase
MTAYDLPETLLRIPGVQPLELEVAQVHDLGPHMRRLRFTGRGLESFTYQPGQDVMFVLAINDGRPLSRRYTIRSFDPSTRILEINLVAHGIDGPGASWAAAARPGDRVNGVGPRGKIFLNPNAEWHAFVGDESAAPGYLHMLESVAASIPALALLEVSDAHDELPLADGLSALHRVRWLHRGRMVATASTALEEALAGAELPSGRGHVYIAGEVQRVAAIQQAALDRGLAAEQLSPKAYWGRGRPNAARGEPD